MKYTARAVIERLKANNMISIERIEKSSSCGMKMYEIQVDVYKLPSAYFHLIPTSNELLIIRAIKKVTNT